jgi:hypothetical protein
LKKVLLKDASLRLENLARVIKQETSQQCVVVKKSLVTCLLEGNLAGNVSHVAVIKQEIGQHFVAVKRSVRATRPVTVLLVGAVRSLL